jgi:hypothetical protein
MTHVIMEIIKQTTIHEKTACLFRMDCPVQPMKCVVTVCELKVGDTFDPHFSNECVLARFRPNEYGYADAKGYLRF